MKKKKKYCSDCEKELIAWFLIANIKLFGWEKATRYKNGDVICDDCEILRFKKRKIKLKK